MADLELIATPPSVFASLELVYNPSTKEVEPTQRLVGKFYSKSFN